VSHLTGINIQANKAIVGDQAFAYTSGMYQNGVLRGGTESEILDPTEIGFIQADERTPLLTGREGLRRRLGELGFVLDDAEFERVYRRFRDVAKKKPDLGIRDLEGIVSGETTVFMKETFELLEVQVTTGTNTLPVAAVSMNGPEDDAIWATSYGNGPIDAIYRAIDQIVELPNELLEYSVEALTEGVDALAKVTVRIEGELSLGETEEVEKRIFLGRGADTDTMVASAKAYVFALNRLLAAQQSGRRRQAATEEARREVDEMRARYGMAPASDVMGWSILRDEGLI
jgi:2-isopropylmalate synthase